VALAKDKKLILFKLFFRVMNSVCACALSINLIVKGPTKDKTMAIIEMTVISSINVKPALLA
jgi:hypothetical protein